MCILCVVSRFLRRIVTMLPWLVAPLILLWAFSQLFPAKFRLEITSSRLACVLVLLISIGWYEIILPRLTTWQARRSAQIREKERVEAQIAAKWRKEAIRRCRNCLTTYRDQNPGNGRFMCTYCGHISRRPVLDMNLAVIGKCVGITESYWRLTRSDGHSFQVKMSNEKCSSEPSSGLLMVLISFSDFVLLIIKWILDKRPFCKGRSLTSTDEDNLGKQDKNLCCQETKAEKARRKAGERRKAKLEKQKQEEEEQKQREEVARLVEEQRRLKESLNAGKSSKKEEELKRKHQNHKEKETRKHKMIFEKQEKVKASDKDIVSILGKDEKKSGTKKTFEEMLGNNYLKGNSRLTKNTVAYLTELPKAMKSYKDPHLGTVPKETTHLLKVADNWRPHGASPRPTRNFNQSAKAFTYGIQHFPSKSLTAGSFLKLPATSNLRGHTESVSVKGQSSKHSAWKGADSLKFICKRGPTEEYYHKKTAPPSNVCSVSTNNNTQGRGQTQLPVGSELQPVSSEATSQPKSWQQHLIKRSPSPGVFSCSGPDKFLEIEGDSLAVHASSPTSFYSAGCFDQVPVAQVGKNLASVIQPPGSPISNGRVDKPLVNLFERNGSYLDENGTNFHIDEDLPPITELWSLPSLSLECSKIFPEQSNRQIWNDPLFEENNFDNIFTYNSDGQVNNNHPLFHGHPPSFNSLTHHLPSFSVSQSENEASEETSGNSACRSGVEDPSSNNVQRAIASESVAKDGPVFDLSVEDTINPLFASSENNYKVCRPLQFCSM